MNGKGFKPRIRRNLDEDNDNERVDAQISGQKRKRSRAAPLLSYNSHPSSTGSILNHPVPVAPASAPFRGAKLPPQANIRTTPHEGSKSPPSQPGVPFYANYERKPRPDAIANPHLVPPRITTLSRKPKFNILARPEENLFQPKSAASSGTTNGYHPQALPEPENGSLRSPERHHSRRPCTPDPDSSKTLRGGAGSIPKEKKRIPKAASLVTFGDPAGHEEGRELRDSSAKGRDRALPFPTSWRDRKLHSNGKQKEHKKSTRRSRASAALPRKSIAIGLRSKPAPVLKIPTLKEKKEVVSDRDAIAPLPPIVSENDYESGGRNEVIAVDDGNVPIEPVVQKKVSEKVIELDHPYSMENEESISSDREQAIQKSSRPNVYSSDFEIAVEMSADEMEKRKETIASHVLAYFVGNQAVFFLSSWDLRDSLLQTVVDMSFPMNTSIDRKLDLSRNSLCRVTKPFCERLAEWNLVSVDISCNKLSVIDSSISFLRKLRKLDLSRNKLGSVPVGLCELESLEVLDLKDNLIVTLPKGFRRLKKLEVLDVSENTLEYLPGDWVGEGSILWALCVSGNEKLKCFPECSRHLRKLIDLIYEDTGFAKLLRKSDHKSSASKLIGDIAGLNAEKLSERKTVNRLRPVKDQRAVVQSIE